MLGPHSHLEPVGAPRSAHQRTRRECAVSHEVAPRSESEVSDSVASSWFRLTENASRPRERAGWPRSAIPAQSADAGLPSRLRRTMRAFRVKRLVPTRTGARSDAFPACGEGSGLDWSCILTSSCCGSPCPPAGLFPRGGTPQACPLPAHRDSYPACGWRTCLALRP